MCKEKDCNTRPIYNYEGEKQALYCKTHKLDGMIDVKHKTCKEKDCNTQPIYNYEREKQALYCKTHKLDGMINVKSKTCKENDCNTQPNYNYEGEKQALYCSKHKLDGMIDVKNKTCKNNWCDTHISNKRYNGYCLRCFIYMFPNIPVARNYKTKETSVVEFVKNNYNDYDWISDKIIKNGCSKRRPDLLLDLGYQVIIIEIDENQHIDYDCSCENKRLMELSRDLNHRPIIFIRFNPDSYIVNNNKIKSCWSINKNGICVINKKKRKEWDNRLNTLINEIEYWIDPINKTNKTLEIVQLYFDDFNLLHQ